MRSPDVQDGGKQEESGMRVKTPKEAKKKTKTQEQQTHVSGTLATWHGSQAKTLASVPLC